MSDVKDYKTQKWRINMNKVTIEILVPDDAGNDIQTFAEFARQTFHESFKGNQDYIDSNVIVSDDGSRDKINESCLTIDFTSCKDKMKVSEKLVDSFCEIIESPEYQGVVFG